MTLVLFAMDYRTASLDVRERLYLTSDALMDALAVLREERDLAEVIIVSTCNRLEIYGATDHAEGAFDAFGRFMRARAALDETQIATHFRHMVDDEAVHHLMRVACGLESVVLGETQILGQVIGALKQAQRAETAGPLLTRLFNDAVHTGKRARAETGISRHTLSVSHAAVGLARQHFGDLSKAQVLVVGAGQMAELGLRALKGLGVERLRVINRTGEKARILAERCGAEALPWERFSAALCESDVIITAVNVSKPLICAEHLAGTSGAVVIDIGVPRNVDPRVRDLAGVHLYDIDDLQAAVADHRAKREGEIAQVERIIAEEAAAYRRWIDSRSVVSTIVALRQKARTLAASEVDRTLHRLPDLSDREAEIIAQMAHRIVNKLLHAPTAALSEPLASEQRDIVLKTVRELFDLQMEREHE